MRVQLPSWCEWHRGTSPVLLVAPHGGRRPLVDAAAPPPRLRVNDLYTPELTRLLAARLDAGAIINHGQDRNTLDLNRLSQVRRRAPWFLELLVEEIDAIIARCGTAEVVFVHGWNIGQPKCDIGVGLVETDAGLYLPGGATRSVSEAYLQRRIAAVRAGCAAADIETCVGARYPASHPNNLVQLFTPHARDGADATRRRIADRAARGCVNALQLELGIPLRWPGAWCDRFVEALVAAFNHACRRGMEFPGYDSRKSSEDDSQISRPPQSPLQRTFPAVAGEFHSPAERPGTAAAALQFYDPAADVGMFAGVGRMGARAAGRLLLFLGGQRVALFTGEGRSAVPPLEFTNDGDILHLSFTGPMLVLDDAVTYLDLEAALAASRLVEAKLRLEFSPVGKGMQFGMVRGEVAIGHRRHAISAGGFANAAALRASGTRQQTMIAADFGAGQGLLSRVGDDHTHSMAMHFADGAMHALRVCD